MKKGISAWAFPREVAVADRIRMAKKAGFEGIELTINDYGEYQLDTPLSVLREFKRVCDGEGIETPSFATGMFSYYPISAQDPKLFDQSVELLKKMLESANVLGADSILMVPGRVGYNSDPSVNERPYDEVYRDSVENLRRVKHLAEDAKVCIGIENVWNMFLLSPIEMRDFVDAVDSEYVGVYFDQGNILYTGYPQMWIRTLGKRICKVHFKDYSRRSHSFVGLLHGDTDWPDVVKALDEVGYDDYCIAEVGHYRHYWDQALLDTSAAMDRIFAMR